MFALKRKRNTTTNATHKQYIYELFETFEFEKKNKRSYGWIAKVFCINYNVYTNNMHTHFRSAYLPSVGSNIRTITRQHAKRGRGMGSVLLSTGGPGAGSSYSSIDDYEHSTGRQVSGMGFGGSRTPRGRGGGMSDTMVRKLTSLIPPAVKRLNHKT